MMPSAMEGMLAFGNHTLALALRHEAGNPRHALELTTAGLARLEPLPGYQARELREKLSRLFHRLRRRIAAEKNGVAAVVVDAEPEAGHLGPVSARCSECDEEFAAPHGKGAPQPTTCPRCRRLARPGAAPGEETPMGDALKETPAGPGGGLARPGPAPQPTQKCRVCGGEKPLDAYQKNHTYLNGHESICKECRAARYQARKADRAQAPAVAPGDLRVCTECHEAKPATDFARHSYSKDGLSHKCRACMSAILSAGKRRAGVSAPVPDEVAPTCTNLHQTAPDPPLLPMRVPVDLVEMAAAGSDAPAVRPGNWAALAAPVLLGAGVLALGAYLLGRVLRQ